LAREVIDSHSHLAGPEFQGDLLDVVQRARDAGVSASLVIVAADDGPECARAGAVAAAWPACRFSIGVHPHAAGHFADDPARAAALVEERLAGQPLTRAIGEIGLDYHYDFAPRDVQQRVFRGQLRLAARLRLPVVIHTREADEDTLGILDEHRATLPGVLLHCFTGDRAMADRAVADGYYLSISGIVTFPRALELHQVAAMVPLDRLLIETDSPFLAPVPHRGTRNEPAYVVRVADAIARLRATTVQEVADATTANFTRLFDP
jgi:TatD DNase family protein